MENWAYLEFHGPNGPHRLQVSPVKTASRCTKSNCKYFEAVSVLLPAEAVRDLAEGTTWLHLVAADGRLRRDLEVDVEEVQDLVQQLRAARELARVSSDGA